MLVPKPLKKGDTIGLISTSSSVPPALLEPSIKSIERLGFHVYVGETCKVEKMFFAGRDELRAKELNEMFRNPKIDGIFCIRGGYGATRILPLLDYELIKAYPKVFAGYSDVTAIHIAMNQICHLVTYHTPMPSTELIRPEMDEYSWKSFYHAITNTRQSQYILQNPETIPISVLVDGKATGVLIGGNLSLVTASLGTPFEIDTKNKILFLEDIDEHAGRIDRMLTQLKLAGKFDEVEGILLGTWTNCKTINSYTFLEVFEDILGSLKVPIMMNIACGHSLPTMSLPLGRKIAMDTYEKSIRVIV